MGGGGGYVSMKVGEKSVDRQKQKTLEKERQGQGRQRREYNNHGFREC